MAFAHLNAGKHSKVIDLDGEAGRAAARVGGIRRCRIESFQPGELDAKGLGYKDLAKVNPGIVMASITCFGQTGPKKNLAYNDLVALAESGILYVCGDPSTAPCKAPESQAYYFASLFATAGVLAALYRREKTGQGDHIDTSMQETLATHEHIIRLWANDKQILARRQPWLGGAGENLSGQRRLRLSLRDASTGSFFFPSGRIIRDLRRGCLAQQRLPARSCR
jgi:crotonobetainyl-CoA:carnitine CoA-transferase CaiB-like acyl-CoA transferase